MYLIEGLLVLPENEDEAKMDTLLLKGVQMKDESGMALT